MSRAVLLVLASALMAADAAQAQPAETLTPQQQAGKAIYDQTCVSCHDARGHATTYIRRREGDAVPPLAQRTNLTPAFVKLAVRRGVGSMPWFQRTYITDAQLADLSAYLTRLRPAPARPAP